VFVVSPGLRSHPLLAGSARVAWPTTHKSEHELLTEQREKEGKKEEGKTEEKKMEGGKMEGGSRRCASLCRKKQKQKQKTEEQGEQEKKKEEPAAPPMEGEGQLPLVLDSGAAALRLAYLMLLT
jgi:hypothetical protein